MGSAYGLYVKKNIRIIQLKTCSIKQLLTSYNFYPILLQFYIQSNSLNHNCVLTDFVKEKTFFLHMWRFCMISFWMVSEDGQVWPKLIALTFLIKNATTTLVVDGYNYYILKD
jgi:hypothetical protein